MATAIRIAPYGKFRKLISDMNRLDKILLGDKTQNAMERLANATKDFIVDGIEKSRPSWKELNEITKTIKGNGKILVDSGAFVDAMKVWKSGARWFAGLPDNAKGDKGQDLNIVGEVHENGAHVPVSEEMRKFFAANGFPLREETKFVRIPERPWFAPAQEELNKYADTVLDPLVNSLLEEIG
jgi:hypothetical protein